MTKAKKTAKAKARPSWEVQTEFTYGWENCWHDDDGLITFATRAEAVAAMREAKDDARELEDGPPTMRVARAPNYAAAQAAAEAKGWRLDKGDGAFRHPKDKMAGGKLSSFYYDGDWAKLCAEAGIDYDDGEA